MPKNRRLRALTKLEWTDHEDLDDEGRPRTVVVLPGETFREADFPEKGGLDELLKHESVEEDRG